MPWPISRHLPAPAHDAVQQHPPLLQLQLQGRNIRSGSRLAWYYCPAAKCGTSSCMRISAHAHALLTSADPQACAGAQTF